MNCEPFNGRSGLPKLIFTAYEACFKVHDRGDAFRANRHVDEAKGGGKVCRSSLLLYARRGVLLLCNYCLVLRGLDLSTVRA